MKHPVTNLIGYEGSQRIVGVSSGTTLFDASLVRISGNPEPTQVVVVREDFSPTLQVGSEAPPFLTLTQSI
jgi:hypothetical protein